MAFTKVEKVHAAVHAAAAAAAAVGGGLAQIPMSDAPLIAGIQLAMISAIALAHGRKLTEATATAVLGTFTASMFGRAVSQVLVGWIPGAGNAINATTAAAITEGVGWSAHKFFERLGDEPLTDDEIRARAHADVSLSAEQRETQKKHLLAKGLMRSDERLVAFYNAALVSPIFGDDLTNTCLFVTDRRVVQVREGRADQECLLANVNSVEVEHNSIFSDDYIIVTTHDGIAMRFAVIREEIARAMKSLILSLAGARTQS